MLKKVLIANRAEIAIRVIKACKELDIKTVAIFAENDRSCLHINYADEAYNLGSGSLNDTYRNIEKIIDIAKKSGAEAIHPGYGFLSENAAFSQACDDHGIIFIGPTANVINSMGDKISARKHISEAGLPLIPGTPGGVKEVDEVLAFGERHGYPIALKASAGGGGRGIRPIYSPENVKESLEGAMREGLSYFGDDTVYVEKYFSNPRHIEVQIIGDGQGNVIHLGERNCSVQRRNQKLVEECPSPYLDEEVRQKILNAAVTGAKHLNYRGAGTFEFLEQDGQFYFMEVNTRLQVEHPITEMVCGVDLVKEQLNVASGNKLSYTQDDIKRRGHAIECRITVEDVSKNFRPMAGLIKEYKEPSGFGVRFDSAGYTGWNIPSEYDSMIAKLIVWDETRERALMKASRVLDEYVVEGVPTTIEFHKWVMKHPEFVEGNYSTSFIGKNFKTEYIKAFDGSLESDNEVKEKSLVEVEVNGKHFKVEVIGLDLASSGSSKKATKAKSTLKKSDSSTSNSNEITAPMAGTVVKVVVEKGQKITKGQTVLVLEAMKMESDINSPRDAVIKDIKVKPADAVSNGQLLIELGE
jgi:acetyl-CoA/propionyl-CoA carboxylase biotin carboxyl carrier protein